MASKLVDEKGETLQMVNHKDYPDDLRHKFIQGGYSEEHLDEYLGFVPDWVPAEYRHFFSGYYGYRINGIELATPGPAYNQDNELKALNEDFRSLYNQVDEFFAIGYIDGHSWVVYKKTDDGSIEALPDLGCVAGMRYQV
ncbi:MAG TPA: hypothetical protein H9870_10895 [Candidatus Corynebacterium avicola]|uniref:SMI1/KNR4 family protein n=1 Tax=Candidatus Corynebacterium avicola TaxID=2838527 RepID=A0A9D1RR01_9CORY|nr:hypothetical protein [Candidatus Corynebacterium avicola]